MATHRSLLLIAAAAAGLAGCGGTAPAPAPRAARPSPPIVVRPLFPADYVAVAASVDLFVIRSSELALERSSSERVRDTARTMVDAHRGMGAQLSFAGRRLNIVPPASMRDREQQLYEELIATSDFDATYRRQQLAVHREALKLHGDFAQRGESPTLRPVAANAAGIIRRHLGMLEGL